MDIDESMPDKSSNETNAKRNQAEPDASSRFEIFPQK
jgi:hypothetical protein